MRQIIVIMLALVLCSFTDKGKENFHKVKPKKGDGIISFLKRYELNRNRCNVDQFYKLNKLKKGDKLVSHKSYYLPVIIYDYDGRSIRSTIEINDWEKAVRIKNYNENLRKRGLRRTRFTDSRILWVPYNEVKCTEEKTSKKKTSTKKKTTESKKSSKKKKKIKGKKNTLRIDYFGKKYRDVKIEDHSLKDKVYYIVSGHGGPDPGAQCKDYGKAISEDEYAYDIALRLARNLMQHGATVHVIIQDKNDGIRDEKLLKSDRDETILGKYAVKRKQKARLNQRAAAINRLYRYHKKRGIKNQMALFLHIDSRGKKLRQDVYFYHHKNSEKGKKVATSIMNTFNKMYDKYQKGRGYKGHISSRGLYVLNYTQPTSVFLELGNIQNKEDHKRFLLSSNRQAVANWIFEGVRNQ